MASNNGNIYGEIDNKTDMRDVFLSIRKDVEEADKRSELTELYKRAGYLITLTHSPSWEEKFGNDLKELRDVGEEEFARTARKINSRAQKIDTEADYDETWGN